MALCGNEASLLQPPWGIVITSLKCVPSFSDGPERIPEMRTLSVLGPFVWRTCVVLTELLFPHDAPGEGECLWCLQWSLGVWTRGTETLGRAA